MNTYENIIENLNKILPLLVKEQRLNHIYAVNSYALKLAKIFNLNPLKISIASLAHDLFRDFSFDLQLKIAKKYNIKISNEEKKHPILLHGKNSALYMKKRYNISNDIFNAIYYHTSGSPQLNDLGKVLVISDSAEETRSYPEVNKLRNLSLNSIEEAYKFVIKNKITYAISKRLIILEETVNTWNKYIMEV
ncbi:metal-dependent phosphohydrolase [Tepiditoga spiralis]|uniref:Metal-dependent phosphohydrolase n=1 Tax=Tepiditoga spiralis TaxID=2108365 RepID=A0A7G1G5G4_9BACT|nr:bis(5'-nucleosyl)-tetraphosphatase (symmetrical) YqeK [Tepiditoga spiralis]BBE31641.1 metal-dependent phosphohydrolase [Tepiditoga spiralis]